MDGLSGRGVGDLDEGEEIKSGQKQPLGLSPSGVVGRWRKKNLLVKGLQLTGALSPNC